MANFCHIFFFIALFLFLFSVVDGTNYVVGGDAGWNVGVDYSAWTVGKTFFVGDSLVFMYKKGEHNVLDVNVTAFAECAAPTNQPPMESGHDVVRLLRPGTRWFLCSIANHCDSQQKLIIFVDNHPPTNITHPALPPVSLLPATPVPAPTPTTAAAAPSPSVRSPGQNQTKPHLPAAPTPRQSSIPPISYSPVIVPTPSATAPPPSGANSNSAISVGVLAVAVGVLAGIMT